MLEELLRRDDTEGLHLSCKLALIVGSFCHGAAA